MRMSIGLAIGVLGALAAGGGCAARHPKGGTDEITIAAAADLQFALKDVLEAFHRAHPDIRVKVSYGSSGKFYAQLANRAPFDMFLSADLDYPRRLIEAGAARKGSVFIYAVGHLVVWVRQRSALDVEKLGLRVLLDRSVRKIALANPRFAPYGRAAEAALRATGLYEQVKDRLVLGESVAQAAQFVQTGAADAGLIGLAQAMSPTLRSEGRYSELPQTAYPRMEQGGVILTWAADKAAARALRDFLLSAEGKAILNRFGFAEP